MHTVQSFCTYCIQVCFCGLASREAIRSSVPSHQCIGAEWNIFWVMRQQRVWARTDGVDWIAGC